MEVNRFNKNLKLYISSSYTIPETAEEFIYKFFTQTGFYKIHAVTKGMATYEDKNCTILQTSADRYRSFDDVYILTRTYFPEITLKEVLLILLLLDIEVKSTIKLVPQLHHCAGMGKIRIVHVRRYGSFENPNGLNNPYLTSKYRSEYSWGELLLLIGVKNYEEYKYFIKRATKIDVKNKNTFITTNSERQRVEVMPERVSFPKTILGLKLQVETELRNVTIGENTFTYTDIIGMINKFKPFKKNDKEFNVVGSIEIDGKKISKLQLEKLLSFIK